MTNIKNYAFDFISEDTLITQRIPISALTIRRRVGSTPFCSVTLPDPEPYTALITSNLAGTLVLKQIIDAGLEVIVGTYILDQILTTRSPSGFTIVLNAINTEGDDQPSTGSYTITKPITSTEDSKNIKRFSAEENALIVLGDTINFSDSPVIETTAFTVQELSLFVNTVNSRMDVGII